MIGQRWLLPLWALTLLTMTVVPCVESGRGSWDKGRGLGGAVKPPPSSWKKGGRNALKMAGGAAAGAAVGAAAGMVGGAALGYGIGSLGNLRPGYGYDNTFMENRHYADTQFAHNYPLYYRAVANGGPAASVLALLGSMLSFSVRNFFQFN
uniref:Shadow of prion protein n=1 Tax=Paramormyrops kingsleyae TaxID=1676925 RepID=A0A3B3R0Q0_9TELE